MKHNTVRFEDEELYMEFKMALLREKKSMQEFFMEQAQSLVNKHKGGRADEKSTANQG